VFKDFIAAISVPFFAVMIFYQVKQVTFKAGIIGAFPFKAGLFIVLFFLFHKIIYTPMLNAKKSILSAFFSLCVYNLVFSL
jgi:hypothetical protein